MSEDAVMEDVDEEAEILSWSEMLGIVELPAHEVEELAPYFENLEETELEAAGQTMQTIVELTTSIQTLVEITGDSRELLIDRLEVLCTDLLDQLYVVHDTAMVRQFVQNLLHNPSFMEEGTHEQKTSAQTLLNNLAQLVKQEVPPHTLLGRIALQFRLSWAMAIPRPAGY